MAVMQISINDDDITQQETAKEEEPKKPTALPNQTVVQPTTTPTQATTAPSASAKTFGNLFGNTPVNKK